MKTAVADKYRCPDDWCDLRLNGQLSDEAGYFQFGQSTICYGQTTSGFRAAQPGSSLYDVLNDVTADGSSVFLPFNPADVIDNLRLERYAKRFTPSALNPWMQSLRDAYYLLRPLMPVSIRKHVQRARLNGWREITFPRWPVDTTVEQIDEQLLIWTMKAKGVDTVPFVWFWPDGAKSCVVLTHDVEGEGGKNFCADLMDIDEAFGFRASFQLVPEGCYKVPPELVEAIMSRGFEVNIQDFNHDGHLFRDKEEFLRRAEKINGYGKSYGANGFRAAVLYRNQDWYDALDFSFDMSIPNVAHLDPQMGGCCTVMPYFIGNILELPVTTMQDYMLFHLLGDYSVDIWKKQVEAIIEKNGLVSFIIHPDYVIEKRARDVYRSLLSFLQQVSSKKSLWFALPGEVDRWWRLRSEMSVIERDGHWHITGPGAERARLAFARLAGDHLVYDLEAERSPLEIQQG